jgi:hypothetical protein
MKNLLRLKSTKHIATIQKKKPPYYVSFIFFVILIHISFVVNSTRLLEETNKKTPTPATTSGFDNLISQITPIADENLLQLWQTQYGCYVKATCQYQQLDAKSFKEALWMKRKGYLNKSILDLVNQVVIRDLSALALNGNLNALKLMALHNLNHGDLKQAKGYALAAQAKEGINASYSLRLLARVYLADKQPILALIELRMAALLGDSDAANDYEKLIMDNSPPFHNYVNKLAFLFLSQQLDKPIKLWDEDKRTQ